ncbi:MAG: hypothetical protein ACE5H0_04130 [Bacteroidota bacterium]
MFDGSTDILKLILSLLLFPLYFQDALISFAWGANEQFWIMIVKRILLLLPISAIIVGLWVTIPSLVTVLIRQNRKQFVITLFVTWWDLGKSIVSFWGGILKFVFSLSTALLGLLRILFLSVWSIIQDVIFMPFRLIRKAGQNVVSSPIPWIAVFLTLFWSLLEALIFTYVTTPLVVDVFSNITGETLSENIVRIPLFIFLLFIVLGSYAVLSTMVDAVKNKNISAILGIGVIEIIALFVEVVFLYREFVDSLVPWLAQYSEGFQLGIVGTLVIACFVWLGVRSLSWFLFAAHGTPTILTIIQGKGLEVGRRGEVPQARPFGISAEIIDKIKENTTWMLKKTDELMASFMLPPLQVVAASINFLALLVTSNHLFVLPFKTMGDILNSRALVDSITKRSLRKA